MITENTMYNVKNRSTSMVVYRIPETNLRREFQPGETKRIAFGELEKLTYQPGGRELLEEFLQIVDEDATTDLNVHREVEYDMSEEQVKALLVSGSLDAFLDALDFAPVGVIDLIKSLSVSLPLTDYNKREALKKKTGFDVDSALRHLQEERAAEEAPAEAAPAARRVQPKTETTPGRRTESTYKVIKKEEVPVEETPSEE